jgi:hypothetical protein
LLAAAQASPNRAPVRLALRAGRPVAATSRTIASRAPSWVAFSAVFHQKNALPTSGREEKQDQEHREHDHELDGRRSPLAGFQAAPGHGMPQSPM